MSSIDTLAKDVQKILKKYGNDVSENLTEITKAVTRKGAAALRSQSASVVGGRYPGGWTSQVEVSRLGAEGVIYNRRPGLPHLLEYGHAKRNGGRTAARTHIKPVEEELIEQFEQQVEAQL